MDGKAPLQSIINFRDVGIATGGSAALPPGRLYRCYDIDKATKEDNKYLHGTLGITTLINLNGPPETFVRKRNSSSEFQEKYTDKIRDYSVLDVKVFEIRLESNSYRDNLWKYIPWKDRAKLAGHFVLGQEGSLVGVLNGALTRNLGWMETAVNLLALSKPQIKAVFEALAVEEVSSVLIYGPHTSLVLCLLLGLLGVAEDRISHEYLLTERSEEALLEQVNAKRREFGAKEISSLDLPPSYVPDILEHIDTKYQGIDVYLSSIGLTHNQLESVKKNLQGTGNSNEKLVDVEEQYAASRYA